VRVGVGQVIFEFRNRMRHVPNLAEKTIPRRTEGDLKASPANFLRKRAVSDAPIFIQANPIQPQALSRDGVTGSTACDTSCSVCPAFDLLCGGLALSDEQAAEWQSDVSHLAATVHTIPARRLILHPKEWSEFVPIICSGWAMSSVALPDGRRQILSFLLPGDLVSAASLLAPMSGQSVEAITAVTYRKFRREDVKNALFGRSDLLEKLFSLWSEAKGNADQLALDLGRRRADERIARLILRLAEKVAKRTMVRTQTFDFPLRQRHIADATGLTPVHVSKVLGELQRAGLVEISGRSLTIINAMELQRVADWR
jgi:CRP-like cAMP-binding protein